MSEPRLASMLYPESDCRPAALEAPYWAEIHIEWRKKGVTATFCGRVLSTDANPSVQLLTVLLPLPDLVPAAEALNAPIASRW